MTEENNKAQIKEELRKSIELISSLKEELKQKEKELALKSKMEALGELGLGFAHEVKNPLSAITTYLELLNSSVQADKDKDVIRKIRYSVNEIDNIINNLLLYTKDITPNKMTVVIRDLLDDVIKLIDVARERKAITITININSATLTADYDLLKRALINIISNAIDECGKNGNILIESNENNNSVLIAIEDTGSGINNPEKIFEPFYTTKTKGMGLGLPLIKKFMEIQRGTIRVAKPRKLSGARFELLLPK